MKETSTLAGGIYPHQDQDMTTYQPQTFLGSQYFNPQEVKPVEHEKPEERKSGAIVSIILPAYNAHNTIKKTLASIAMQEGSEDIEVIIANDCSKFGYEHIAEQFQHMLKIRIVNMKKNGGPGAARQVGFDHSSGQYVMWMDADDTLVSADTIKTLVNVIEQRNMDIVYGKFLEENENGSIFPHEMHMV